MHDGPFMTLHRLRNIKKEFPQLMEQSCGIITAACSKAKIERRTYYNWRNKDPGFAAACDEVLETTADMVEYALLKKIQEGNTTAIIFYCKTKMKHRGYIERCERMYVNSNYTTTSIFTAEVPYTYYIF